VSIFGSALHESVKGVPKVGDRFVIGQSVHRPAAEAEQYFVRHDAQPLEAQVAPLRWIEKRYPKLGRYDWEPQHRPIVALPTGLAPRFLKVSREAVVARMKDNLNRGRALNDGILSAVLFVKEVAALRLRCVGQTRHLYYTELPGGGAGPRIGSSLFCGLEDGTHDVEAIYVLRDGTTVRQDFQVVVKLKARYDPAKLTKSVQGARDRVKRFGSKPNLLQGLWQSLYFAAASAQRDFGAPPEETEKRLQELLQLFDGAFGAYQPKDARRKVNAVSNALVHYVQLCRETGTARAYQLATGFLAKAMRVPGLGEDSAVTNVEDALSKLAASANHDLAAAKRHWAKRVARSRAALPGEPPYDLAWWPVPVPFDAAR